MTRTVDEAIADLRTRIAGRPRWEDLEPRDDELILAEVDRLRAERNLYQQALLIIVSQPQGVANLMSHSEIAREALRLA